MTSSLRSFLSALMFSLTGVGTALLGATLPATLHVWHLTDSRGGLLLLAAWAGSTAGALLARGNGQTIAALGLALSAGSLAALSVEQPVAPTVLFLLYGLGLGTTMTSISLLRAREVSPKNADVELNRLNLLWAAGACLAPSLALHSLRLLSVGTLFRALAAAFSLASLAALATSRRGRGAAATTHDATSPTQDQLLWAPLRFGLFALAAVGIESAIGSWLTTYAQRSTLGVAAAVSANSVFWAGLLLSRAAHSLRRATWFHTRTARILHLAAAGAAIALLLFSADRRLIPVAGLFCGLGLGPLYPYILSVALPRYRSTALFVMAGVGASVTPWLTGALSSAYHSLRIGLLAPAAAFLLLVASGTSLRAKPT